MKTAFKIVAIVIGISLAGYFIRLVLFPARTATEILEQTFDADNVVYNYEYFFKKVEALKAIDTKIANNQEVLKNFEETLPSNRDLWKYEDRQELSRLKTVVSGLQSQRANIVADYNAKSQMVNRKIFKDGSLPYQLE